MEVNTCSRCARGTIGMIIIMDMTDCAYADDAVVPRGPGHCTWQTQSLTPRLQLSIQLVGVALHNANKARFPQTKLLIANTGTPRISGSDINEDLGPANDGTKVTLAYAAEMPGKEAWLTFTTALGI